MSRKQMLYRVLVALGGHVPTQTEWRTLGQLCGYSAHRDLAGFFGGPHPSMMCFADGSRELTSAGWARARRA